MDNLIPDIGHALLMALGMFWKVGWSLVLGFLISAILQVFVSKERMSEMLGRDGPREIALAAGFGAASSSCSYASTAIVRTLLQKGAGFITSLAFLFSSTNLVIELGIVLYLLMGWQFMAAEWLGGIVLIVIMSVLVRLTYPRKLVEEARQRAKETSAVHEHARPDIPQQGFWAKLFSREGRIACAQSFVMDWSMLWVDLVIGFLVSGFLVVFVPETVWQTLFVTNLDSPLRTVLNALIGPFIAIISFVCSIGNVPMAAVLWGSGISFAGVLSFIYADLIVLPLLDVYRRYFGWKMAVYIGVVFYVTMVLASLVMDAAFTVLNIIPENPMNMHGSFTHFAFDYTFWLNLVFGAIGLYLVGLARVNPMQKASCCGKHDSPPSSSDKHHHH